MGVWGRKLPYGCMGWEGTIWVYGVGGYNMGVLGRKLQYGCMGWEGILWVYGVYGVGGSYGCMGWEGWEGWGLLGHVMVTISKDQG